MCDKKILKKRLEKDLFSTELQINRNSVSETIQRGICYGTNATTLNAWNGWTTDAIQRAV